MACGCRSKSKSQQQAAAAAAARTPSSNQIREERAKQQARENAKTK